MALVQLKLPPMLECRLALITPRPLAWTCLGFDAIATFSSPESTRMMAERVREPAVFRLMLSWLLPSPPVQGSMLVCPQVSLYYQS
ncbi:hypothetical protein FOCG_00341 [Fusarium oxysporum f. sp. radicis-lycopersici 26381]|nr:hypothetical protein FOCG_00341 [Fusarium oxysporum f. sp. radicis-lycopersici 26381]EXL61127.1 hypothetical protein FOCG_00341 [Fusarium oxysporum f. sp. radicis-lycopersici 26381]